MFSIFPPGVVTDRIAHNASKVIENQGLGTDRPKRRRKVEAGTYALLGPREICRMVANDEKLEGLRHLALRTRRFFGVSHLGEAMGE